MISAYSDTEPYYPEMDSDRELDKIECSECGSAQVAPDASGDIWMVLCGGCGETSQYAVSPNFHWYPGEKGFSAEFVPEDGW